MELTKKKVLYVITKSNYGGAQRYVYDLATNVPKDRYDVAVAYGGTGENGAAAGTLEARLKAAGVRTLPLTHFMRNMSLGEDIRAFFELLRVVRAEHPDILHVTSSKAGGVGALAGQLAGVRSIVFTSHGLTFDESWRPRWQRTLIWLFTWLTILLSTRTIQISRDTQARAAAMPFCRRKVHLVWNGIDAPDFLTRADARRQLLPIAKGETGRGWEKSLWLGTIAELHPNKNLGVLIDALALLHAQNIPAHLCVLGDGEERAALTERARTQGVADYVHLVGYVKDASRYLTALDVFALPSRKEGLPYVLLEAGHASLPCVVSDISGNTDIVEHEKSGLAVPQTAEAFADALVRLHSDKAYATRLGDALNAHTLDSFSIHRMVTQTVGIYELP